MPTNSDLVTSVTALGLRYDILVPEPYLSAMGVTGGGTARHVLASLYTVVCSARELGDFETASDYAQTVSEYVQYLGQLPPQDRRQHLTSELEDWTTAPNLQQKIRSVCRDLNFQRQ